jgi:hypothetical protein
MPPKSQGTSYSGKPVRRLKLPKIGPTKTKSLFEEYFYILLAAVFVAAAILGKAGGFSIYNAVVVAAWIAAILWFAKQGQGYLAERSKSDNEKPAPPPAPVPAQTQKGPLPLPPGMKPMIGPQWPVRTRTRPAWPGLPKEQTETLAHTPTVRTPGAPTAPNQTNGTNSNQKKQGFVYERPTLPDRKPKLPHNWADSDDKKANHKKPKR